MTSRLNEVDASMHTVIHDVHPVNLVFSIEEIVESSINVLGDGSPRVVVVDEVAKAWRINHCKTQANAIFLDICAD